MYQTNHKDAGDPTVHKHGHISIIVVVFAEARKPRNISRR